MIQSGQKKREQRKRFQIGSRTIDLTGMISDTVEFMLWGKTLVDQAVKPSPEASMIWAGVCLVLPLFTNHHLAEQSYEAGFDYVTTRMEFYIALEPRLFPSGQQVPRISEKLQKSLQKDISDLYQRMLEFEFESVLRFYNPSRKTILKDVANGKSWDEMLSRVKAAEKTLDDDLKRINDTEMREELEMLNKRSSESIVKLGDIVRNQKEQTEAQQEQLKQQQLTKYTMPSPVLRWTCLS